MILGARPAVDGHTACACRALQTSLLTLRLFFHVAGAAALDTIDSPQADRSSSRCFGERSLESGKTMISVVQNDTRRLLGGVGHESAAHPSYPSFFLVQSASREHLLRNRAQSSSSRDWRSKLQTRHQVGSSGSLTRRKRSLSPHSVLSASQWTLTRLTAF
jgi:hypothetical protein